VKELYLDLSFNIGCDVTAALEEGLEKEASPTGREILSQILKTI
jgi:tartrate dehydratase alpha subunit/fumarate hydratase class I-like protein